MIVQQQVMLCANLPLGTGGTLNEYPICKTITLVAIVPVINQRKAALQKL
jgi:hypothetical protein